MAVLQPTASRSTAQAVGLRLQAKSLYRGEQAFFAHLLPMHARQLKVDCHTASGLDLLCLRNPERKSNKTE